MTDERIRELVVEALTRRRDEIQSELDALSGNPAPARQKAPKKQGRTPEQKAALSRRMKAIWAKKKKEAQK